MQRYEDEICATAAHLMVKQAVQRVLQQEQTERITQVLLRPCLSFVRSVFDVTMEAITMPLQ